MEAMLATTRVIIHAMLKRLAGPLFIATGFMHFVIPHSYIKILPRYLPAQRELVYAAAWRRSPAARR